jgi:hypothetical protein
MTLEDIRSATMTTISSNWATATAICFPNQAFTVPAKLPWIRPIIKMADTVVGEIGEKGVGIRSGILMISVFEPAGGGTKRPLDFAARLENIFRRKEISGIIFNEASTDIIGLDDNGLYHVMVTIDFNAWIGE